MPSSYVPDLRSLPTLSSGRYLFASDKRPVPEIRLDLYSSIILLSFPNKKMQITTAFQHTAENIELRGSWLHANLRRCNGDLVPSQIDLNEHIANNDGEFDLSGSRWFDSARAVRLDGTILHAQLRTKAGKYSADRSLDLSLFLSNEDGNFKFIKPYVEYLHIYMYSQLESYPFSLYIPIYTLQSLGTNRISGSLNRSDTKPDNDGPSKIDLNDHDDGDDRHSVFSLLTSPTSATISTGILREDRHTPNERQEPANLATCFVNENGRLVFQMQYASLSPLPHSISLLVEPQCQLIYLPNLSTTD